jgi:hypothetical protein
MGMNAGIRFDKPLVSPDALEARMPICPQGAAPTLLSEIAAELAPKKSEMN